jgi:hypothetical protein
MKFLPHEQLYLRTEDCLRYLRDLPREPRIGPPRPPARFHLYRYGPFTRKAAFAVKSFLATQDLASVELWVWLDEEHGYSGWRDDALLRPLLPFVELRRYEPEAEARDTPLERRVDLYRNLQPRARSDAFRLLVLHRHGGIYADADTMFLRDMRPLLGHLDGDEFCERWSAQAYGVSAFLGLREDGRTARALMVRCAELGSCHPRDVLRFDSDLELENLLVLPCAVFDPLWLHNDGRDRYDAAPFDRFRDFFRRFGLRFGPRTEIRSYHDFFPGAFAYHWHGHWRAREHDDSYFARFDRQFDEVLADGLGIRPARRRRSMRL